MLKTKKLKRNWGEDDLKILVWVVSKYGEVKELQDLEKDIVRPSLPRLLKTGNSLLRLSQE